MSSVYGWNCRVMGLLQLVVKKRFQKISRVFTGPIHGVTKFVSV